MEYLLDHYRQTAALRIFVFDGVSADRSRSRFTVSVDTALLGRYTISLQELPLLCRRFLENRAIAGGSHTLSFAEADMAHLFAERAEALQAVRQRKFNRGASSHRPPANGEDRHSPAESPQRDLPTDREPDAFLPR
jgi:hypothetical protein